MHFTRAISLFITGLAVTGVIAAPTFDSLQSLNKRETFPGYCNPDTNACMWSAQDGSGRVGTCTCSTGNQCGVTNGRCYYNDQTLQCICPTGA